MNKFITYTFRLINMVVFCAASLGAAPTAGLLFRDQDRWAVVGDSITQGRTYYAWIFLYQVTRFPDQRLDVFNCGISGDTVEGALRRYDWDIGPNRPTVATIMLGMNDVKRYLYGTESPSEANLALREKALQEYRANLLALTKRLQSDGARVIFITPSPADDTADLPSQRFHGVNAALGRCADSMREIAAENGVQVIDLHGPMTALNLRLQTENPAFTLVGPDRVHPGLPGQFVMAYYFLKGQGSPTVISNIEIDASTACVVLAENVMVEGLQSKEGVVRFDSLEKALPFPIPQDCVEALDWVPAIADLNQEILRITNLPVGKRTLLIDGQVVGEFDAAEFAAGINLATLKSAPQVRQAEKVLALVRKWQTSIGYWDRSVAQVEHSSMLKDQPRPIILDDVRPLLEARLNEAKDSQKQSDKYTATVISLYLKTKANESQTEEKLAMQADAIRKAAHPVKHHYEIR